MGSQGEAGLTPGSLVAGYRIERELGRGNMAVVYLATQMNLMRPVALKVLAPALASDEEYVCRFFNEARAAAALSHPNIIQVHDAGVSEDDIYFLSMEYVEGESLEQCLARERVMEVTRALSVGLDVAQALQYGWQARALTHGDIKPENIMISSAGMTKLADFGLAKVAGHEFAGKGAMLTPLYGAPEVIRGTHVAGDCRADIYSFGATLYHMLCGQPPFPGNDPETVMARQLSEPAQPVRERNPAVPAAVSDYVGCLLQKSPDARPGSWAEVAGRLKGFLSGGTSKKKEVKKLHLTPEVAASLSSPLERDKAGRHGAPKPASAGTRALVVGIIIASAIAPGFLLWRRLHPGASVPEAPPEPVTAVAADRRAAAPKAVPAATPSPQAQAETAWRQLEARLKGLQSLDEQLRLLEAFRDEHGDQTPDAVYVRLREVKEAIGRAQAAAKAGPMPEPPPMPKPPPSADGGERAAAVRRAPTPADRSEPIAPVAKPSRAARLSGRWKYTRTVTIAAGAVEADLTDFPVLVSVTDPGLRAKAQADGGDIVFTLHGKTAILDCEVERYDKTTGALQAWVRVTTLHASSDTVLDMHYGNPACGGMANASGVWDGNYVVVLHMGEASGSHADSTGNGNTGAPENGVTQGVAGKVGGADGFDGEDDVVEVATESNFDFTQQFTLSAWIKPEGAATYNAIIGKYAGYTGWDLILTAGRLRMGVRGTSKIDTGGSTGPDLRDGDWHFVAATITTSRIGLYVDGVNVQDVEGTWTATTNDLVVTIGERNGEHGFAGRIDEVRVSSSVRSAAWLNACFRNQSSPSTFHTIGTEHPGSLSGSTAVIADAATVANRSGTTSRARTTAAKGSSIGARLAGGAVVVAGSLLSHDPAEKRGLNLLRFALVADPGNADALLLQAKLERNQEIPRLDLPDAGRDYVDFVQSVIRKTKPGPRQLLLWRVVELVDPVNEAALQALAKAQNAGADTRLDGLLAALAGDATPVSALKP
ncbi:MAG: hypothetical protein A3K19_21290 [Lentisphaerae bacterium RIFOXYB12_FULL_65_16]|nr:MAG: hypothetical protein A3K18_33965 [Lentisphaerae bacterium RIFOXYA12_64_32]OGV93667.1 MAG: hypothetical protein A3K19_21290 [Lentisphaerae bacterium RIFOXYB12_FULL_65_16]